MKYKFFFLSFILLVLPFAFLVAAQNTSLPKKLEGRILLQVEGKGEAWYVYPGDLKRYYMGRPADALTLMQQLGKGISTEDLRKIPVGMIQNQSQKDSDNDGVNDNIEHALSMNINGSDSDADGYNDLAEIQSGYDPLSEGKWPIDTNFINTYKGRILLQVQDQGQGWYIYPVDGKRYFLGNPQDAFSLMKKLALGVTNKNLEKIPAWQKNSWTKVKETEGTYQFNVSKENQSLVVEFSCDKEFSDMTLSAPTGIKINEEKAETDGQYNYYTVPEKKTSYFGIINAQKGTWKITKENSNAGRCNAELYLYIDINNLTE